MVCPGGLPDGLSFYSGGGQKEKKESWGGSGSPLRVLSEGMTVPKHSARPLHLQHRRAARGGPGQLGLCFGSWSSHLLAV